MADGFVVPIDDKYPENTSYEMGTVLLYQAAVSDFLPQHQVIAVAPPLKSPELHPLELEVQRSLEIKRQNHLARSNSSVIQTLPSISQNLAVPGAITITHCLSSINSGSQTNLASRLQGDNNEANGKVVWQRDSTYQDADHELAEVSEAPTSQRDDTMDMDAAPIPLTVQYCTIDAKRNECNEEVSDSDDDVDIKPVFDHEPDPEPGTLPPADMDNRCYMCFKKFRQKKNMYAHIRKLHSSQPKIEGGIVCPLCKMHSLRHDHLRTHLRTLHNVQITKEERQFDNFEEFNAWKEFMELETMSHYITKSAMKLLAFNETKTYYKCHRSGFSTAIKAGKKKSQKPSHRSSKIEATCPAAMEVLENALGITVTFWATHVGHSLPISNRETPNVQVAHNSDLSNHCSPSEKEKDTTPPPSLRPEPGNEEAAYALMDKTWISFGRKPKMSRLARSAPQSLLVEKADILLGVLASNEVAAPSRPLISAMIDNLTSIVQRRIAPKRKCGVSDSGENQLSKMAKPKRTTCKR